MKVSKPMKVSVLCRPIEQARQVHLHIAAMLGFRLSAPRGLLDEVAFWAAVSEELGQTPLDDAVTKVRGELLVSGRCFAPGGQPTVASYTRVQVGSVDKRLSVVGDRVWHDGVPTAPEPFLQLPVTWNRAFGGPGYAMNPYGCGIEAIMRGAGVVVPLPNIEPFGSLLRARSERPAPAGFMPMDVSFGVRRELAGNFGNDYLTRWVPGLPPDHSPQFFNVAPADQQLTGFWSGDEAFEVENMNAANPQQRGALPGLVLRAFVVQRNQAEPLFREVLLNCDTVWLFPSIDHGAVIFHGKVECAEYDAADIEHLLVACEDRGRPRSVEHYRAARMRRLDKDRCAIAELSDSDLMPEKDSGVVANVSFGALGQWIKTEGLARANAERGRDRQLEQTRARILEVGGDPSVLDGHAAIAPEVPTSDDLDAVAAFMEKQMDELDGRRTEAMTLNARIAEEVRKAGEALGEDPAASISAGSEQAGGPPRFTARAVLQSMRELATTARAEGTPALGIEKQLEDPTFIAQLTSQEKALLAGYRYGAHLMPLASPMTEEAAGIAKLVVGFARDTNESLAERDFTGTDFRGLDLTRMDFSRAFLEAADLRGADLSGANFEGAVLAKADLRGAKLLKTRLRGANLGGANLEGATFDDADLTEAILMRSTTTAATFRNANLTGADMLESNWRGVDLRGARFERCTFLKADLTGANLTGAHLVQATFLECTLDDAVFDGANLHKASIISCKGERTSFVGADLHEAVIVHKSELPDANFTDANLERCCMRTTVFRGARFQGAKMTMSDLSECDASNAKLDRAVLKNALLIRTTLNHASARGVNLNEALLTNARIAGADFTGAQMTRADFMGAVGDDKTRFTEAVVAWTRFDAKASKGAST